MRRCCFSAIVRTGFEERQHRAERRVVAAVRARQGQDRRIEAADAARAEFKPQVDALESSLTLLDTALKNVQANGTAAVQRAAQDVESANADLQNAIKSKKCS